MTRNEEIEQASKQGSIECFGYEEGDYTIPFRHGAEWADRTMIDKVCGYLSKLTRFVCCSEGGGVEQPIFTNTEIELFKHKMIEE